MSSSKNVQYIVEAGGALRGTIRVAGDKSISHRSIMLGALADGTTEVNGFLEGEDALATLQCFRDMGVKIEGPQDGRVTIHGVGLRGLKKPTKPLDCGNSGTSMRLMSGILAGQSFDTTLIGDESLSRRPMKRVTQPLSQMGATIETTEKGCAPMHIKGVKNLNAIQYEMPMASAQVKSCLILAGLYANGKTCVTEPGITRDHTERMLRAFGYEVIVNGSTVCVQGGGELRATRLTVPADISSAAFFMVGASIAKNSDITLTEVGINPTRIGVIEILKLMGANLEIINERMAGGEPIADIRVRSSDLKGIEIPEELVPLAIDEFPVLFVAAACARGKTILTGAEELRVKESDRIQVMADGLKVLGIDAQPTPDGMIINGGTMAGGRINSRGDHRIAMSFTMAALRANASITIDDCANVATSFPNFVSLSKSAGINLNVQS